MAILELERPLVEQSEENAMTPLCRGCGVSMVPSVAMQQTYTGRGDFHDNDDIVTLSPGGPGQLVPAWKCPACGHSVSK